MEMGWCAAQRLAKSSRSRMRATVVVDVSSKSLLDGERREPLAVVAHLELGRIVVEDQERLLLVGLRRWRR